MQQSVPNSLATLPICPPDASTIATRPGSELGRAASARRALVARVVLRLRWGVFGAPEGLIQATPDDEMRGLTYRIPRRRRGWRARTAMRFGLWHSRPRTLSRR